MLTLKRMISNQPAKPGGTPPQLIPMLGKGRNNKDQSGGKQIMEKQNTKINKTKSWVFEKKN